VSTYERLLAAKMCLPGDVLRGNARERDISEGRELRRLGGPELLAVCSSTSLFGGRGDCYSSD
jgi:hypothetical protein